MTETAVDLCNEGYSRGLDHDYDTALKCFDKALSLDPNLAVAWSNKGNILARLDRFDESFVCHRKAVSLKPVSFSMWLSWAEVLILARCYEEALEKADRAIKFSFRDHKPWLVKGNALVKLERPEEALECYKKAISIDKKAVQAWSNQRALLMRLKRYEEALACNEHLLALEKEDTEHLTVQGILHEELHHDHEALEWYQKTLERNGGNPLVWINAGWLNEKKGNLKEAIEFYNRALCIDPTFTQARRHIIALSGRGREDFLLGALRDDPDNRELYVELGYFYLSSNHMEKGQEFVMKTLDRYPEDTEFLSIHAWLCLGRGRVEECGTILKGIVSREKDSASAYFGLAYYYFIRQEYREAEEAFRHVLRLNPAHFSSRYYLAVVLSLRGKYSEALRHIGELESFDLNSFDLPALKISILLSQGKGEEAEQLCRERIQKNPEDQEAQRGLISSLLLQDRAQEVENLINRTFHSPPDGGFAGFTLGSIAFCRSEREKAGQLWKPILEKEPEDEENYIFKTLALCMQGENEEAGRLCKKALALFPGNLFFGGMLGLILTSRGMTGEAEELFVQQAERFSDVPQAHFFCARFYFHSKRHEEAAREFRRALAPEEDSTTVTLAAAAFLSYCENEIEQATAFAERCLARDRRYADAYFLLGLAAKKRGDREKASEFFTKARYFQCYNIEYQEALDSLAAPA